MRKTKLKTTTTKRKKAGLPEVVVTMLDMPETVDEAIKMSSPEIVLKNNNSSRVFAYQAKIRRMLEATGENGKPKFTIEQISKEMEGWKQPEPPPRKSKEDKWEEEFGEMSDEKAEWLRHRLNRGESP